MPQTYTDWNERRDHHPTRALGDKFKAYVRSNAPSVTLKQNGQTVTFGPRPGEQVAMRLRKQGLVLAAIRSGREERRVVEHERDFPSGLDFVRRLTGE